jgi:sRNA-binding regulator protein Hfq
MWTVYAQGIATYFGRHLSDTDNAVFKHALSTMLAAADAERPNA